jgi:O-antigen ligase
MLFWIFIITCTYSENINHAFKKIETTGSLIIFPLIFALLLQTDFKLTKKITQRILLSFCLSVVLFLCLSFIYFWNQEFTFLQTIVHYSNLINIRLGLFSIHPIYLSIYTGVGMLFLIKLQDTNKKMKIVYLFMAILYVLFLAVLARRGPVISLFLIGVLYIIFRFHFKKILWSIFAVALFSVIMLSIPKYQNHNRFTDLFDGTVVKDSSSSLYIRYNIYKCSLESVKESPLIGYGLGDVQNKLTDCYTANEMGFENNSYNSHNQYIGLLLISGLTGLFLYLYTLYVNLRNSLNFKFYLTASFFFYFIFNFFTENILEREAGVLLYSFFGCLFLYVLEKKKIQSVYDSEAISL